MRNAPAASLFDEYRLSRLMLGTVQFGQAYGIANKTGRPSFKNVLGILECALANGVNCLDTAHAYGDSEEVLGKAMQELKIGDKMIVVTKVPILPNNLSLAEADRMVEQLVRSSLKRLRLDFLPICLFHSEKDAVYAEALLKMKEKGVIKHAGISADSPEGARRAVKAGYFEAMQLPTSILDQRYIREGIMKDAAQKEMGLFIRSVYLQGLLFLADNEIPPALSEVIAVRRRLQEIARKSGMDLAALAVRFVMSMKEVNCLVMGLETIGQLQDNLKTLAQGPLNAELLEEIRQAVPKLPEHVLRPSLWPKSA